MAIMMGRPVAAMPGRAVETAAREFSAAAPGFPIRGSCAPRTAASAMPVAEAAVGNQGAGIEKELVKLPIFLVLPEPETNEMKKALSLDAELAWKRRTKPPCRGGDCEGLSPRSDVLSEALYAAEQTHAHKRRTPVHPVPRKPCKSAEHRPPRLISE